MSSLDERLGRLYGEVADPDSLLHADALLVSLPSMSHGIMSFALAVGGALIVSLFYFAQILDCIHCCSCF